MHKLFNTLALLLLSLMLQACGQNEEAQQQGNAAANATRNDIFSGLVAQGDPAEKTFQTLDGKGFDVDFFAGQKVFINFWATWCAPCIREIPSINRAAAELADEGYLFVFVSDEDNETIEAFLQEREFAGNFVRLNGYFARFGIGAVPSSWLMDETGEVIATWAGAYEWDSDEMLAEIRNPSALPF